MALKGGTHPVLTKGTHLSRRFSPGPDRLSFLSEELAVVVACR
jgi:hypothetical protein